MKNGRDIMLHLRNDRKKIIHTVFFTAIVFVTILTLAACGSSKNENESGGSISLIHSPDADIQGSSPTPETQDVSPENETGTSSSDTASPSPSPSSGATASASASPSPSSSAVSPSPTRTPSGAAHGSTPTPTKPSSSNTSPTPSPSKKPSQSPTPKPTPSYNGNQNFTDGKTIHFSHPSGFYAGAFQLKLEFDPSYTVYYTTNGNEPTRSSAKYVSGISITDRSSASSGADDNITVVRAAAYNKNGTKAGATVTATYIVNKNAKTFAGRYNNLAVVSISTDSSNLYGRNGIITNYTQHGRESERPAHVEFFDSDGTAGFSIDAGIRVYGGTSRTYSQKSFKLIARKEYDPDNGKFKYAMLPGSVNLSGKPVDRFDSFILRSGGNDSLFDIFGNPTTRTLLRDALAHALAGNKIANIAYQAYRPVVVYINGEYAGLYNLRDDTDNDHLEQHYGVPKDEVAIVTYGHENGAWFYKADEGTDADVNDYANALKWIASSDMRNSANYDKAGKMIDLDNMMKYVAVNVYANNKDWSSNNIRVWKYTGKTNSKYGQDGKWRYMLKDIDYAWGWYWNGDASAPANDTAFQFSILTGTAGEDGSHPFAAAFSSLMKNSAFRNQFFSLMDKMANDYFSPQTAKKQIEIMRNAMKPELKYIVTNVWYDGGRTSVRNTNQWEQAVNVLIDYANQRPNHIKNLMNEVRNFYGG